MKKRKIKLFISLINRCFQESTKDKKNKFKHKSILKENVNDTIPDFEFVSKEENVIKELDKVNLASDSKEHKITISK